MLYYLLCEITPALRLIEKIAMTSIDRPAINRRKPGVRHRKKEMPKMDMTPMVDLGFLLISFFVITTELNKPVSTSLNMPKDGPPIKLGNSNALTVLLADNDKIYYYQGNWQEAAEKNRIFKTNLSAAGLRSAIILQKHWLEINDKMEGKDGLMLLIKSTEDVVYKNVIDVLDEVLINEVKKYTLVKMEPEEIKWIKDQL